ncbi:MAG: hypothetical protein HYT87_04995 [Nitrospirae bacterium]|nr:hypothetical protein [Nitrospirota bacterium]
MVARTALPLLWLLLPKLAFGDQFGWKLTVSIEPAEISFLGSLPVETLWAEGKSLELTPARDNPLAEPNQLVISGQRVDLNSFQGRQFYVRYTIPSGAREIRFVLVDANKREREGMIALPEVSATALDSAPAILAGDVRADPPAALGVSLTLPPGYQLVDRFSKTIPGDRPTIQVVARKAHGEYPIFLKTPEGLTLIYRLIADLKLPEGWDWPERGALDSGSPGNSPGTLEAGAAPRIRRPKRVVWTGLMVGVATATAAAVTYYNARVQQRVAERTDNPDRERELRNRIKIENAAALGLAALSGASFGISATVALAW